MSPKQPTKPRSFGQEAERILSLPIAHRVNRLGGYGAQGEVIYEAHPSGGPSVLVDSQGEATVTLMSNGSIGFSVKPAGGAEVSVLDLSFDFAEKREIGVPSSNVWIDVAIGTRRHVASIINPKSEINSPAKRLRLVKLGDPARALWYGAAFEPIRGVAYETAVKCSLVSTAAGPAIKREVFVRNVGRKPIAGSLWTFFFLHGTQRFVYNKQLWYDIGLPLMLTESVVAATVPYSDAVQIKRVTSTARGMKAVDATCDYSTFVGDTSVFSTMPEAVRTGRMVPGGAGRRLNRFSTAACAANQFAFSLKPGESATLQQALLYVTDQPLMEQFRRTASYTDPSYAAMSAAFRAAAKELVDAGPRARAIMALAPPSDGEAEAPAFEVALPAEPVVSAYANSVWTGVKELYEKCRAHGAKLADGIELGTRDRGQDMWPKMKEDPGRVRADLVHALGFMYVTAEFCGKTKETAWNPDKPLSLPEKLHGMFPRQYPSRWNDRRQEVMNDNRPYADSPLWLLDSLFMYLRETGDTSILNETVTTVRLTDPEHPITSGIVGCDRRQTVLETVCEVFECFERHVNDSPYGMAQILYGDWCDPIDMYGTSVVGDATTRGQGRGVQTRLSAHLFLCLVEAIDCLSAAPLAAMVQAAGLSERVEAFKPFAARLRQNVVRWAWEDDDDTETPASPAARLPAKMGSDPNEETSRGQTPFSPEGATGKRSAPFFPGFVDSIHEFRLDGSRPDYAKGERGYTLGSMRGTDPDGVARRQLANQAYGLAMLRTERDYLPPVEGADEMVRRLLDTTDRLFFRPKLGLVLFTRPIANNQQSVKYVGRMGLVPSGCAENGEYHHGQVMMHRYRMRLPGQADTVWREFKPVMSALRDETICGPFETPCTSYASDPDDPHFGKGMYFGLSGSTDWIVEIFHEVAGLRLALHDPSQPAVRVTPNLPATLNETLTFRRVIHAARLPAQMRKMGSDPNEKTSRGPTPFSAVGGAPVRASEGERLTAPLQTGYRRIPLTIDIRRRGSGPTRTGIEYALNGHPVPAAEVASLDGLDRVHLDITYVYA
jgi:hypothetical protein